jgi:hypothetical protein
MIEKGPCDYLFEERERERLLREIAEKERKLIALQNSTVHERFEIEFAIRYQKDILKCNTTSLRDNGCFK